jgi:hypothetical protein
MKNLLVFFLGILLIIASCANESDEVEVGIDIQERFDNNLVQVFIDGEEKLNKTLTTNTAIGAGLTDSSLRMNLLEGKHEIKVVVDGTIVKKESFTVSQAMYIGVNFDNNAGAITMNQSSKPFLYM